jgi:Na+/proline symporter
MASILLATGYPVALCVLARLRPVLAERRVWWFLALEAATASITAGWLLHGRPLAAAVNGAALVGFAIAWWITGRRADARARQAGGSATRRRR